ncbi:hypothetical protein LPJ61_005818, partial [Coemansia biformis]
QNAGSASASDGSQGSSGYGSASDDSQDSGDYDSGSDDSQDSGDYDDAGDDGQGAGGYGYDDSGAVAPIVPLQGYANVMTVNGGAPVATIGTCPDYTITVTNQVFATLIATVTPTLLAIPQGPQGIVPNAGAADPFGDQLMPNAGAGLPFGGADQQFAGGDNAGDDAGNDAGYDDAGDDDNAY